VRRRRKPLPSLWRRLQAESLTPICTDWTDKSLGLCGFLSVESVQIGVKYLGDLCD